MIQELYILSESCIKEMRETQDMIITAEETNSFYNSQKCCSCDCDFEKDDKKVRDHDHRTGKFRGPAHNKCNINYFNNRYLPVVFHNLKGYDGHMIIKKAYDISKSLGDKVDFKVVPHSYEKFMSFNIGCLKFIDSFQFMASSLEKLVEHLYESGDNKFKTFQHMNKHFGSNIEQLF